MSMIPSVLLFVLILLMIGALPVYQYSRAWGPYPAGGLGVIVVLLLVLMLLGRL